MQVETLIQFNQTKVVLQNTTSQDIVFKIYNNPLAVHTFEQTEGRVKAKTELTLSIKKQETQLGIAPMEQQRLVYIQDDSEESVSTVLRRNSKLLSEITFQAAKTESDEISLLDKADMSQILTASQMVGSVMESEPQYKKHDPSKKKKQSSCKLILKSYAFGFLTAIALYLKFK